MHMADALISPVVGAGGWAATLGLAGYSARIIKKKIEEPNIALMGVGAAFVFAAQMINFSIPGTGSSGHLGGGLILAALLGPHAAYLAMASILTIQALFFADGGLLSLGCNVFNLAFFPCFLAYPLLFRRLTGGTPSRARLSWVSVVTAVVGLQLGAMAVVIETQLSGISALPLREFLLLMLPIHLAIGVVEGLATAAVLMFVHQARPDVLHFTEAKPPSSKPLIFGLLGCAVLVGAVVSWFASGQPDGLEWSMEKTSGSAELESPDTAVYSTAADVQKKVSFLPDYKLPNNDETVTVENENTASSWPAVDVGTSLSGIVGIALTLLLAGLIGLGIRRRSSVQNQS
ncbi:MAG: energy-coupling factor ABC transporter permease [Deltaproteobacteria bacterium]|nr:energy-coupling factor ABC transporter permease [Deltaproteobacteria bacterium]